MHQGHPITVELILRKLAAARSFSDILDAYPQLADDDLRAASVFAADSTESSRHPMRFVADENVSRLVVARLRAAGFDVLSIGETRSGASDDEMLAAAVGEDRLLITEDRDSGEMILRQQRGVRGLVLLELDRLSNWRRRAGRR